MLCPLCFAAMNVPNNCRVNWSVYVPPEDSPSALVPFNMFGVEDASASSGPAARGFLSCVISSPSGVPSPSVSGFCGLAPQRFSSPFPYSVHRFHGCCGSSGLPLASHPLPRFPSFRHRCRYDLRLWHSRQAPRRFDRSSLRSGRFRIGMMGAAWLDGARWQSRQVGSSASTAARSRCHW